MRCEFGVCDCDWCDWVFCWGGYLIEIVGRGWWVLVGWRFGSWFVYDDGNCYFSGRCFLDVD